jgi:hypothetical protein
MLTVGEYLLMLELVRCAYMLVRSVPASHEYFSVAKRTKPSSVLCRIYVHIFS